MPSRNTAELTAAPAGRPGVGRAADSARACRSGAQTEPAACLAWGQPHGATGAVSLHPVAHRKRITNALTAHARARPCPRTLCKSRRA